MVSDAELKKITGLFKKEAVLLFPTDTVMGIGCRFDSEKGIARLREIKGIDGKNPLAVLISDIEQLDMLKVRKSSVSNLLMSKFWPGPLTIVLTSEDTYPCSGEGNSLGLRLPDAAGLRRIIEMVGIPLAATSANVHGQPDATRLANVSRKIVKATDYTVDIPINPSGISSTVVKIEGGIVKILREGLITRAELKEVVGDRI